MTKMKNTTIFACRRGNVVKAMGKPVFEDKTKELDMKVLYKRSVNTNLTNSTCCSGASQLVTKSGYLHLTPTCDRHKVKRDLSIETDACILRRQYKIKRHKMSNQGSSVISKYSTVVDTEIETIEEYPDSSACGDNELTEERSDHPIDLEALMVTKLKSLLGQWIQKNLIHKEDTQNKFDYVLDSILHKLDSKVVHKTSSDSTYVIDKAEQKQQVKNKKIATSTVTCQHCKSCRGKNQTSSATSQQDSSTLTVPSNYKGIKIISTLSIPRGHSPKLDHEISNSSLLYKLRKLKRKNLILSLKKSNKLHNSSTFDVFAISTKSLTKRCAHCNNSSKKKRHLVVLPKPFLRNTSNTSSNAKHPKGQGKFNVTDETSTLLKSLYTTSIDKNVQFNSKNDNFTMTENTSEDTMKHNIIQTAPQTDINHVTNMTNNVKYSDQSNQSDSFITDNKNEQILSLHAATKLKRHKKPAQRKCHQYSRKRQVLSHTLLHHWSKINNVYNNQTTYLYKKTNDPLYGREFVKYCRNVFRYADHDTDKDIKVDVRINIFPMVEPVSKDACTNISNQALELYDTNDNSILLYDNDNTRSTTIDSQLFKQPNTALEVGYERDPTISSSHCTADVIPLLDGAAINDKYIFKANSDKKSEAKSDVVTGDVNQLGILQEISELRAAIKDLAITAEKFVSEQIKKKTVKTNAETYFSLKTNDNYTSGTKCEAEVISKNPSKTTQVSIEFGKKQAQSEIDKEAQQKDMFDYYNRLTKKSTSYRIIDSESLLKVTDMTSKGNDLNFHNRRFTDEALMCSFPKSRSLFELTSDRNKKLVAFFCDNYVNPKVACKIRDSRLSAPSPCKFSKTSTTNKKPNFWSKKASKRDAKFSNVSLCSQNSPNMPLPDPSPGGGGYSSTVSCRSTNSFTDEEDQAVCKVQRRRMSFSARCMYCLLLWIPIVIIIMVFYSYVLKDSIASTQNKTDYITITTLDIGQPAPDSILRTTNTLKNTSKLILKLSDLGF